MHWHLRKPETPPRRPRICKSYFLPQNHTPKKAFPAGQDGNAFQVNLDIPGRGDHYCFYCMESVF